MVQAVRAVQMIDGGRGLRSTFSILLGGVLLVVLNACAGIRAFPEAPFESTGQLESTRFAFLPETYQKYYNKDDDEQEQIRLRNKIANAQIRAYDIRFQEFEQNLFDLGIGLGVGTDWASLALSGLTATVGSASTKAALGAANSGLVGAKGALDKHLFMEKTLPVIMTEMANQRSAILLQIRIGLNEDDVRKYSLDQALGDIQRYARAGSISAALTGIAASSGRELKVNVDELNELTKFSYLKDFSGDKLREFWKPDGQVNAENENKIKETMISLGLAVGPGRIVNFLRSSEFAELRIQAIKRLGL